MLILDDKIPNLIKYMGSKSEIINYVINGLNEVHKTNQDICDLFAGSSTLSGALRNNDINIISNDIQIYSSVLSKTYTYNYDWNNYSELSEIILEVENLVDNWKSILKEFWNKVNYENTFNLKSFNELEDFQRELNTNKDFLNLINTNEDMKKYHLFMKNYSGTYWNLKQCIWIDAFRCIADKYKDIKPLHNLILSCTAYAMAYNSQSTGHYAQYRKADNEKSMKDILIYRRKNMKDFFERKFNEIKENIIQTRCSLNTYSLSYEECIDKLNNNTLVYADPPYCSVHYSRFYHILETFIKYDYPEINYTGRYRTDRHQSPFCITSKVRNAFNCMFTKLKEKNCELVLSYSNSNTSMIKLETILLDSFKIFNNISNLNDEIHLPIIKEFIELEEENQFKNNDFNDINININSILGVNINQELKYDICLKIFKHKHSTMGRNDEKNKDVLEILVIVKIK